MGSVECVVTGVFNEDFYEQWDGEMKRWREIAGLEQRGRQGPDRRRIFMPNNIAAIKNYTSGGRMVRAGRNAKEITVPKISVTGLGDYTRNVEYKTGSITSTTR